MRCVAGNAITVPGRTTTVGELRASASQLGAWTGKRVLLASDDPIAQLTCLLGAADVGFELALVPAQWLTETWLQTVRHRFDWVCTGLETAQARRGGASGSPVAQPGLVIFTSGSTRAPTPVAHAFEALDTFGRIADPDPQRWLVAYRTGSYAWTQVVLFGLLVADQELTFARSSDPADLLAALGDGVSAVSSTPSFWRYLLTCSNPERMRSLALRQITLGGEPVDQPLLDRLKAAFAGARITQIYASTECGAVLACSDGRAGFPASCLEASPDANAPQLRIRDGTLRVRSPYSVAGSDTWIDTRDVAEVADDRLYVKGRVARNAINVGGHMVALDELEAFVHELAAVAWARAYPVPSAIVGSLVGLDVVLDARCTQPRDEVERDVRAACRSGLGEPYEPRVVRFVSRLALAPSLKALAR